MLRSYMPYLNDFYLYFVQSRASDLAFHFKELMGQCTTNSQTSNWANLYYKGFHTQPVLW